MPRPRHQPFITQPVQQLVQPAQRVGDPELLLDERAHLLGVPHPTPRVGRLGVQMRAELLFLLHAQVAVVAAPPVGQTVQARAVVIAHPLLDSASATRHRLGNLRRGLAPLGQDERLKLEHHRRLGPALLKLLKFLDRVMRFDVHDDDLLVITHHRGKPPRAQCLTSA